MADGAFRQVIRRLVPRRLRWLARAAFKRITGLYYRDMMARLWDVQNQVNGIQDSVSTVHEIVGSQAVQIETQGEVMDLLLRRLRVSQEEVVAHLGAVEKQVATLEERVTTLSQPLPNELSTRTVGLLNFDKSALGFQARFGQWINPPVNVEYTPEEVRWNFTNERVVEIPFTFQALSTLARPARILDIGAHESLMSLHLASLGHRVTAIDTRPYPFAHPNLTVIKASILDWEGDGQPYDAVIILSTLEHLGLPVYGQTNPEDDADEKAMAKVRSLARPGSLLVLTAPFGSSRIEETQRVYSAADLTRHLQGFRIQQCCITVRVDEKTWVVNRDVEFGLLSEIENDDGRERVILIAAERE